MLHTNTRTVNFSYVTNIFRMDYSFGWIRKFNDFSRAKIWCFTIIKLHWYMDMKKQHPGDCFTKKRIDQIWYWQGMFSPKNLWSLSRNNCVLKMLGLENIYLRIVEYLVGYVNVMYSITPFGTVYCFYSRYPLNSSEL